MSATLLSIDALTVTLGGRAVVDAVSAHLHAGAFVAVIGPNGSGKTSFLRALAGQLAFSGAIAVNGTAIDALSLSQRAQIIAYLPQDMRQPVWPIPLRDIIALGLMPFDARTRSDDPAIVRQLADLDLVDLAERSIDQVSGGERMRALLARALVGAQPVILLDEPLTSLDPAHQLRVMALLRQRAQAGALVIAVIHDIDFALHYATRILAFQAGHIAADGAPREIAATGRLEQIFGVKVARADTAAGPILAMRPLPD